MSLLNVKEENKLNPYQISICTKNILKICRGITIPELAMMFNRFLTGEFGHFYGQIDMMVLGEWARAFMKKRGELICTDNKVRAFIMKRDQNNELI